MKSNIEGITEQSGIYAGQEEYDIQVKNNTRLKGAVIDRKIEKEPDRHRYLDIGKYRKQSRIQSKSKRNHCIHQCRIQTQPLRTGLCTDRTREREIRKHHLGRNLKANNRMKSILQMYINK